jgi:hypothetical protein
MRLLQRAIRCLLASLIASSITASAAHARVTEDEVKAAYIFNLAQFVTWPATAFDSPQDPLRLCVTGDDRFSAVLDTTVQNEAADGHPLVVENVRSEEMLQRCHLVFVPATHEDPGAVFRATAGRSVLTVGEAANFLDAGGVVRFIIVSGRVRFDINVPPAAAAGLTVSSRVLQVARYVRR